MAGAVPPKSFEFSRVVRRVADYPHGIAFLREAPLETVAVTLRLHPFVVEAARDLLDQPEGAALFSSALCGGEAGGDDDAVAFPTSAEAEALIGAARGCPSGLEQLCEGPLEEVAFAHGVHPYVVLRARGAIERADAFRRSSQPIDNVPTEPLKE